MTLKKIQLSTSHLQGFVESLGTIEGPMRSCRNFERISKQLDDCGAASLPSTFGEPLTTRSNPNGEEALSTRSEGIFKSRPDPSSSSSV